MMNRRSFLTASAAMAASPVFAAGKPPSEKKGWAGANSEHHKTFGAHWYYNWTPNRGPLEPEFVPMIKGGFDIKPKAFDKIRNYQGISGLLGYNEPERTKQGNLSVDRAIELWPQLVALAEQKNLRIGSPAPSSDRDGMTHLEEFMKRADKNDLRVDFIAIHWYRGRDVDAFEQFIKDLDRKYDRPIWLTEFNGWSGPEEEHYKFLKGALNFLEKEKSVERYAYFNPPAGKPHSLLTPGSKLTRMGELYRDAGT
jgi:hypothetical protein